MAKIPAVYIVRHGSTALNGDESTDRIRGWSNTPLNYKGEEEGISRYAKGGIVKLADGGGPADQEPMAEGDYQAPALDEAPVQQADQSDVPAPSSQMVQANYNAPALGQSSQPNPAIPEQNPQFIPNDQFVADEDQYGTPFEMGKMEAEAASKGILGSTITAGIESELGADPAAIRGRQAASPFLSAGTEGAAFLLSLIPKGPLAGLGLIGKAAETAGKVGDFVKLGEAGGTAEKFAQGIARGAAETALLGTDNEVGKMIQQDPNQSVQTALANIGGAALFGGALGGAVGGALNLWDAKVGDKVGQLAEDFKGRMQEHLNNPDPVGSLQDELQAHYDNIQNAADDVYGAKGLKAQEQAALMPEMSPEIAGQANDIVDKIQDSIDKLGDDPLAPRLQDALTDYKKAIYQGEGGPQDIYSAGEDLKKQLQEWGKYNKNIVPLAEQGFRNTAKNLGFEVRTALEDPSVWGDLGTRQAAVNKAFSRYLPALQDFQKKFTAQIADPINGGFKRVIDPGKINTYVNQLGKPNAEIKQEMLKNYLDASEKYRGEINKIHANLGVNSPIPPSSLNFAQQSLQKLTPGAKLADAFIKKGLGDAAGKGAGAGVGGGVGAVFGHPAIGALIGEHALGPFFNSILPGIAKSILKKQGDGVALKSAVDYGMQVSKGEKLINNATKSVIKGGGDILPFHLEPDQRDRDKLDTLLKAAQNDPSKVLNIGGNTAHYLAAHSAAMGVTAGKMATYLNSIRPQMIKGSPLDADIEPTNEQTQAFNRQLDIAQQPLMILKHVNDNTITSKDMATMAAIYPDLHNSMTSKILDEIVNQKSADSSIPFTKQQSLSLFLGQPLNSAFKPQSIIAAQPTPQMSQPQTPSQPASKPKRTTTALNKVPDAYQTPLQASEQRRSTNA